MSEIGYVCSLLVDPETYTPDTLNLNSDEEARVYWFNCIPKLIEKFSEQAARSAQFNQTDGSVRAQQYVWSHDYRMNYGERIVLLSLIFYLNSPLEPIMNVMYLSSTNLQVLQRLYEYHPCDSRR